jgi:hypothetical protein
MFYEIPQMGDFKHAAYPELGKFPQMGDYEPGVFPQLGKFPQMGDYEPGVFPQLGKFPQMGDATSDAVAQILKLGGAALEQYKNQLIATGMSDVLQQPAVQAALTQQAQASAFDQAWTWYQANKGTALVIGGIVLLMAVRPWRLFR